MNLAILFSMMHTAVIAVAQTVEPFSLRYQILAKGGIDFVSNAILQCDGSGGGGANCADLDAQLPPTYDTWSQNNDHVAEYIDIDLDPTTFSSSSDSLDLLACSEILFAGIYWGGRSRDDDLGYPGRDSIKVGVDGGAYVDVVANELIDAGADEGLGNSVYYCYADITDILTANETKALYTIANVYSRLEEGSNRWGGWNIVVVYQNDLMHMRSLNVFDGLVNVNDSGTDIEVGISDFLTPPSGPVSFEVGVYGYDGDRGFEGDSLLFDGGAGYVPISNTTNPADDIFNSSQTRFDAVTTSQNPLRHNNINIDADIFAPDNGTFDFIGNSATSADIKITTNNETVQIQALTFAVDVFEPDIRAELRVEDINGGLLERGDTLEYTIVGKNIGLDPSLSTFVVDTLPLNIEYVPESIEITFGPNLGVKTDATGDDQAFYDVAGRFVHVNMGSGADELDGGEVLHSIEGVDSTLVVFRATVIEDCDLLFCNSIVENQAGIFGVGSESGNDLFNWSTPGGLDMLGCPEQGTTDIAIDISGCDLPPDTTVESYCGGIDFEEFPYDEIGYEYFDDGYLPVSEPSGPGTYYAIRAEVECADTIMITISDYLDAPTEADAGLDQEYCEDPGAINLEGNDPVIGTGEWTVIVGGATVTDPELFNSEVTGLSIGENTFVWSIINGSDCPPSEDTITVIVYELPTEADAGDDQIICFDTETILDGNEPLIGIGEWLLITGAGILSDASLFNTDVTDLSPGINTFSWTITNGVCPPSIDEVDVLIDQDYDGDGVCDEEDVDDDNDGIRDIIEGSEDSDGDGLENRLDLDSDNDGIPDITEAWAFDADGDGQLDGFVDTDGDGFGDEVDPDDGGTLLANPDSDGDGLVDAQDRDSDNDGVSDLKEAFGFDVDSDGEADDLADTDNDGFVDLYDTDDNTVPGPGDGGTSLLDPDTDGDEILNRYDLDSDNDGIPDIIEFNGEDADGDGVIDVFVDTDNDGFADEVDTDDNTLPGTGDGGTPLFIPDTDLDNIIDAIDLDSDNDGLLDIVEAGGLDVDGNGMIDSFDDVDDDGFSDLYDTDDNTVPGAGDGGIAIDLPNTDGTGGHDYVDIDADDDGIPDNIEGQATTDFNELTESDADLDGIDDAYDIDAGGSPIGLYDHDGDGFPDFQDTDADNDGSPDLVEGHDLDGDNTPETIPAGLDSDLDGLDDAFDTIELIPLTSFTNAGNGTVSPLTDGVLADADAPGIGDLDFRENDTDQDGITDILDTDDDNDGIPDVIEDLNADGDNNPNTNPSDSDGDRVADIFDLDSDNDGIADIVEAGGMDANTDGRVDDLNEDGSLINDTDTDGLDDAFDEDNEGEAIPNPNSDGDSKFDFQDLDSDNDGIFDVIEDGGEDLDFDGRVDTWLDSDEDGILDYADVDLTGGDDLNGDGIADSFQLGDDDDSDGIGNAFDNDESGDGWDDDNYTQGDDNQDEDEKADYKDLDSDNDGTSDITEDGGVDADNDGRVDEFEDANNDGAADVGMTSGLGDFDIDGIPNHEDVDADNDGITDAEENGLLDLNADGRIDAFNDEDGDGWDDDEKTLIPTNTDEAEQPDYKDLDSDNDGIDDIIEGGDIDTDNNGVIDLFVDDNSDGLSDDGGLTPPDTDGDGQDDYQDIDSDNDSVLDEDENDPNDDGNGPDDTDGDGLPDYQDTDDDNDGKLTIDEAIIEGLDYVDCDLDGIPDYLDTDPCGLKIPKAFSPNGDGINDFFVIEGVGAYLNASFVVFNRWGNKVYESINGYPNDWDGTTFSNGEAGDRDLPVGTYFYILDLGEGTDPIKGYVFINR